MTDKGESNGDRAKSYVPLVVALVSSLCAAVGGNYFLISEVSPDLVRPDPFTGAEGRELHQSLEKLEREVIQLRQQVSYLPPKELLLRVDILERDVDRLLARVRLLESQHIEARKDK